MDDPWADPWGESTKGAPTEQAPTIKSAWTLPSPSVNLNDDEDDISNPTWSADPGVQLWASPSTGNSSLWTREPTSTSSWEPGPSMFEGISLGRSSSVHIDDSVSKDAEPTTTESDASSTPPGTPISHTEEPLPPSSLSLEIPSPPARSLSPALDSPDAFGTFATGDETELPEVGVWGGSDKTVPDAAVGIEDAWGSPWKSPSSPVTADEEEEPADEWESARQQKEKQDEHVPPELLASILVQFQDLSRDLWPEDQEDSDSSSGPSHRNLGFEDLVPASHSIQERLIPQDLVLPLQIPFPQTFISKQLADAAKLTRHAIVTRKGPMAMYMSSKASSSWEASLKARPAISQPDLTPVGWKIVEKEEQPGADQNQKKVNAGGGLLSFFSRRSTTASEEAVGRSSSASPTKSLNQTASNSPRNSVDSPIAASATQSLERLPSLVSPTGSTFNPNPGVSVKGPDNSVLSPTSGKSLDFFPEEAKESKGDSSPSVVSRFLGRFSRNSRASSLNRRDSIPLSADDLEFLSDVVPTTQEHAKDDAQLLALSNMIKSAPLPTTLPPPLAPPPRASSQSRAARLRGAPNPPSSTIQSSTLNDDDLLSLFQTPALPEKPATHSNKQTQPLPSIPSSTSAHAAKLAPPLIPTLSSSSIAIASTPIALPSTSHNGSQLTLPAARPSPSTPPIPPPKSSLNSFIPAATTIPPSTPVPASEALTFTATNGRMKPSSSTSALISFPPPPSSRPRTPLAASAIPPLAPPPSSSRPHPPPIMNNIQTSHSLSNDDNDDEFSDFMSSPSQSTAPPMQSLGAFTSSRPTTSSKKVDIVDVSVFDDFTTLQTSTTSQTQPVKVPAATANARPFSIASRSISPQQKPTQSSSPRVSRAEHQRTLSLMETVATRGEKWLSPPSPLPSALPPPDAAPTKSSDLFKTPSTSAVQSRRAQAMTNVASTQPSASSNLSSAKIAPPTAWKFPAPPSASLLQPASLPPTINGAPPLPLASIPLSQASRSSSTNTTSTGKGGLSAQDLAFFEGF